MPFYGPAVFVEPGVMIPRSPSATCWVSRCKNGWQNITKVVDLCAGVGCLGILAAQRYPQAHVTLVELDARAARLARQNVALHNLGDRVHVVQGDACEWLAEQTGQWGI